MKIGELLIKENYLTQEELQEVLAIHENEKKLSRLQLGRILVETGRISEDDLERLLQHPHLKKQLGILAVEGGLISSVDLDACLQEKQDDQFIGEALLEKGLLQAEDLEKLIKEQLNAPKLGELAVQLHLITRQDLDAALRIQKSSRTVGEICCDLEMLTPMDLYYVLAKYKKQGRLGEILINMGHLDINDLNTALQEQKFGSETLGEVLVRKKMVTQRQVQAALSKQSNIPFEELSGFVYSDKEKKILSGIVSQKFAEKNMVLPVSLINKKLTIAILEPEKIHTVRELSSMYSNYSISCILVTTQKFIELFEVLYSARLSGLRSHETKAAGGEEEKAEEEGGNEINFMDIELDENFDTPKKNTIHYAMKDIETEELVNYIIKYGIIHGASDIHFEHDRKGVHLRYRVDGVLRAVNTAWLKERIQQKPSSIVSRIKVMAKLDITERRMPQDGVFRINYFDKARNEKYDLDFRVAICPSIAGENITIRILDSRKANVGLEDLNHSDHVIEPLKRLLKSAAGMILITGPTGSGKTSTLYGALKYIFNPLIKIITAEDPIEYNFPGIMQTQVNPKIDLSFARLLRSFLRLDPDVILVGEIRDEETAKIAFDAAQTGHLVLSTLHTNDAFSTLTRLNDLDIDRSQITASLSCIMAQRLTRRNCLSCIEEYTPDREEWLPLFEHYPANLKFYRGTGCEECGFTGFKGRTLISEILLIDQIKKIRQGASIDEIKEEARSAGAKSMIDDGLLKLKETTLSEITRVVPHEMIEEFRARESWRKRGQKPGVLTDGEVFPLADPEHEQDIIERMFAAYERLAASTQSAVALSSALFRQFITENYHEMSESYKCRTVIFTIENKADKIEISAAPGS